MEPVAEDPREQPEVLPDVAGDREQREAALVGAERDLERVRVEREGGASAPRHLHPHRRPQPQPRRPAPRLHRRPPHLNPLVTSRAQAAAAGFGAGIVGKRKESSAGSRVRERLPFQGGLPFGSGVRTAYAPRGGIAAVRAA